MKRVTIHRGLFSAEGRFTGFNAAGQKFFIGENMLKSLGIDKDTEVDKIPKLFALCDEETRTDKNDQEYQRWEAKSAFLTLQDMLMASLETEIADKMAEELLASYSSTTTLDPLARAKTIV